MRALAQEEYAELEKLQWLDIPKPEAGSGQLVIALKGAAINPADVLTLTGATKMLHAKKFPLVAGYDFSGVVDSVGEGVSQWQPGRRSVWFLALRR